MPAVDRCDRQGPAGRRRTEIALSPDGHGGTLAALAAPGPGGAPSCLDEMRERGVRTLFYFQVDNPLVRIADPSFIGLHREADAEISFKVVERLSPDEKLGVVVSVDGRPQVIEYSDLPPELAGPPRARGAARALGRQHRRPHPRAVVHRAAGRASIGCRSIGPSRRSPYVDDGGQIVKPAEPNAVKFEQFIFDALPLAERWTMVETDRAGEFEPLKNAVGPDSPATVHQRMSDQFANWLEQAGATVPRRPDGSVPFGIEISPLFALDAAELKSKIEPGMVVERPIYLAIVPSSRDSTPDRDRPPAGPGLEDERGTRRCSRDHHGRRQRDPVLAQEPARSAQAVAPPLRRGDDAPADRRADRAAGARASGS